MFSRPTLVPQTLYQRLLCHEKVQSESVGPMSFATREVKSWGEFGYPFKQNKSGFHKMLIGYIDHMFGFQFP